MLLFFIQPPVAKASALKSLGLGPAKLSAGPSACLDSSKMLEDPRVGFQGS